MLSCTFVAPLIVVFVVVWVNARPNPVLTATNLKEEGVTEPNDDTEGYKFDYDEDGYDDYDFTKVHLDGQENGKDKEKEAEEMDYSWMFT